MSIYDYKAVFFDLDGTLIDTAKDLSFAINYMSDELKIKKPGLDKVKNWIGNGTLKLVERSLLFSKDKKPSKSELETAFKLFTLAYKECVGEHSDLYPGTKDLLVKLLANNTKLVCITNKPLEFTNFLLQLNMISQFFSLICAGDNVEFKKPDPSPLIDASNKLGIKIEDCLMIGDSENDITAAKNAGCDVYAVTYGYNQGKDLGELSPNQLINEFNDLK